MSGTMAATETQDAQEATGTQETPQEPERQEEAPWPDEEPEAPQEPAQALTGLSEDEAEKRFRQIERRAETWRKAVLDVLGELAADLEPCPRCLPMAPGFIYPYQLAPITDEQKEAVLLSVNEGALIELKQADDAFICSDCDGRGWVKTGSRVENQKRAKCRHCKGRGWQGPREASLGPDANTQLGSTNGDLDPTLEPIPEADPWGRTRDDPLYGVMPGFERQ